MTNDIAYGFTISYIVGRRRRLNLILDSNKNPKAEERKYAEKIKRDAES
jgi:hypothetical protein